MPTPQVASFNLLTAPWIPVHDTEDVHRQVGIAEALLDAHRLRLFAGSPESLATLRLLIAVLDAAAGPASTDEWDAAWQARTLDSDRITTYLDRWNDRFDLFHPTQPFAQCARLDTPNRTTHALNPGSWGGNAGSWFNEELRREPEPYPADRAARALLTLLAFHPGGIQSAAPGDVRARGGKVYGGKSGALGLVTHLHVTTAGGTLKDDLLLALPPQPRHTGDTPVWERNAPGPVGIVRDPTGRLDQWTWPTRRVRLHHDDGMVTGLTLHDGDRPTSTDPRQSIHQHDPLTARTAKGYPIRLRDQDGPELPWAAALLLASGTSTALTHALDATARGILPLETHLRAVCAHTTHTTTHRAAISNIHITEQHLSTAAVLATPRGRAALTAAAQLPHELQRALNGAGADILNMKPSDITRRANLAADGHVEWAWRHTAADPENQLQSWIATLSNAAETSLRSLPSRGLAQEAQLSVTMERLITKIAHKAQTTVSDAQQEARLPVVNRASDHMDHSPDWSSLS